MERPVGMEKPDFGGSVEPKSNASQWIWVLISIPVLCIGLAVAGKRRF